MQSYRRIAKKAKCPVCHTGDGHTLWVVSSDEAAQHFVLRERDPERFRKLASHIQDLWGQDSCEVVECDGCGFCFSNPYVAGDERFYSLAYTRSGYPQWKWEYEVTYEAIEARYGGTNARLLELGAGNGAFIRKITQGILSKDRILCTEYSDYGRQQIESAGMKCLSVDVRELVDDNLRESFDIVCMFQVLEHMDKLDALFTKLKWLLKKKGSLFIAVPNERRIEFNERHGALRDMPPNHIGRWNRKCFEEVGRQHNLKIEDYKVEQSRLFPMIGEFVLYRALRRAQAEGSFENRIFQAKNRYVLRGMQMVALAANAVGAIPAFAHMNSSLGASQWVHYTRTED